MADKKVKLKDQLGRVVRLDSGDAGATLGKNLYGPDGKLLTADQIINQPPANQGAVATIWKLIRETPANIQALASMAGSGFPTRGGDGAWFQRQLQQGTGIQVTNGDGTAGDPSIALTTEAIASLAKADSAVQEIRPGTGIAVDNSDPRRPIVSATGGGGGGGILPVVSGEIVSGQPVFLIADDGNLIYTEIT
jgi:hypothetical protein